MVGQLEVYAKYIRCHVSVLVWSGVVSFFFHSIDEEERERFFFCLYLDIPIKTIRLFTLIYSFKK